MSVRNNIVALVMCLGLFISSFIAILQSGPWVLLGLVGLTSSIICGTHYVQVFYDETVARRARRKRHSRYLNLLSSVPGVLDIKNPHPQILEAIRNEALDLVELFNINRRIQEDRVFYPVQIPVMLYVDSTKKAFWANVELVREFRADIKLPTTVGGFATMRL